MYIFYLNPILKLKFIYPSICFIYTNDKCGLIIKFHKWNYVEIILICNILKLGHPTILLYIYFLILYSRVLIYNCISRICWKYDLDILELEWNYILNIDLKIIK